MGIQNKFRGVPRDPKFRDGMAGSPISVDLFQHGNEADESLCTFKEVSPANDTSNFGRNALNGYAKQIEKGCHVIRYSWGGGGGVARNTISEDLFQHVNESLCTLTCVSLANVKSNFI